jgi:hypothetical protein
LSNTVNRLLITVFRFIYDHMVDNCMLFIRVELAFSFIADDFKIWARVLHGVLPINCPSKAIWYSSNLHEAGPTPVDWPAVFVHVFLSLGPCTFSAIDQVLSII